MNISGHNTAAQKWPRFFHRQISAARRAWAGGGASLALLCLAAMTAVSARADENISADERFLAGLRQRHLYRLAETYCQIRLQETGLSDERRARLAVEHSRTLAEHAIQSAPQRREELWQRAIDTCSEFSRAHRDSSWTVLASVQEALVLLQRGELTRQQAEVVGAGKSLMEQARSYLQSSVQRLRQLATELDDRLRGAERRHLDRENTLTERQVSSLRKHVEYQLARAAQSQGCSYPPGSPDRAAALQRAVELFGPLTELRTADTLVWRSRLELIVCLRLLGDLSAAGRRLERLETGEPPTEIQQRARAESIRLALAEGKLDEALAPAEAGDNADSLGSAELELAVLEAFLAAWRATSESGPSQEARLWRQRAKQIVDRIEKTHGGYWFRRAESLLAASLAASANIDDPAILLQVAESYYRGGEIDQALAAYDRARQQADQRMDHLLAFELAYTAATIEHERENHQQASRRYEAAALAMPRHDRAAEAHLLAIFNSGQLTRRNASAQTLDQYAALLKEHLRVWPEGGSADETRWRLGRLHEHAGRWAEAIAAYQQVKRDSSRNTDAVEGVVRSYEAWLALRDRAGEPLEPQASAAVRYFEGLIATASREPSLRAGSRLASLASATIRIRYVRSGLDRAERSLREVIDDLQTPSDLSQQARIWLVAVLAQQDKHRQASELLARIDDVPIAELVSMLEALSHVAPADSEAHRQAIAALSIEASKLIAARIDELPPGDRRRAALLEARAMATAGADARALTRYRSLAENFPRDAEILEEYARRLADIGDRPSLELALENWRELQRHSKPGSRRWYRAKYYLAETHLLLGQPEQAEKIVALTQVLHPNLGGPEMKARFLDLLERCRP